MIKLTRLPNPTGALFHNTYKVSGTLTYQEVSAFKIGLRDCFGKDSEPVKVLMLTPVEDAGPTDLTDDDINELQRRCDILETAANATTLEVNRLLESNKHAWEAAGLERQACLNANQEWATEQRKHAETQKELDRVTGALHLEQKAHDATKELLHLTTRRLGSLRDAIRRYANGRDNLGETKLADDLNEILQDSDDIS